MSWFSTQSMDELLHHYGAAGVGLILLLESIGLPLPGESLMIAAAIYAATTHQIDIFVLVPVAALGAIAGDQIGYGLGRWIGYPVLAHWGRRFGISEERLRLGQFLFRRYGGAVVFGGRFIAFMRTFAAILAGANCMPWHTFLLWNGLGGICWTAGYGFGAYLLGDAAKRLSGPIGIALAMVGVATLVAALLFVKRHEKRLLAEAREEMARQEIATSEPATPG
jgi:membrane protein DedA with SNARE-associated domain